MPQEWEGDLKVLYLAHDLSDAAVLKRTTMLRDGRSSVTVLGFRRTSTPIENVAGCKAVNLSQTFNGGFIQRILSVIKEILFLKKHRQLFIDADVILARNLEMLAIAVRGRSLCPNPPAIVYECLDIHRLMLGSGIISKALRALEGWLCKRACAVITSSPAFISEYFNAMSDVHLPIRLVENKVYPCPEIPAPITARQTGKSWKIGWFGIIRCRKSLDILCELARTSNGAVEVIIRGRPALDQFDDFHKTVSSTSGVQFLGAYKNPEDLAAMYQDVHFSWAIDMFEEGLNSSWLLPNRIYEGGLFKTVPIALDSVETGRTLKRMGIGVVLPDVSAPTLAAFFNQLTPQSYRVLETQMDSIPSNSWNFSAQDCKELVNYLRFAEKAHPQ